MNTGNTYKSARVNSMRYIIRKWLTALVITILSLLIIDIVFPKPRTWDRFVVWIVVLLLSVGQLLRLRAKKMINEISINRSNRSMTLKYYDVHEGHEERTFSFDITKIKLNKPALFNTSSVISAYLFVNKHEFYELSIEKDGFSKQTWASLVSDLESLIGPLRN